MSNTNVSTLFNHTAFYTLGRVIVILSGFISFPILTRALEVKDYGRMALINATLVYLIAFSKSGFPAALVRFFKQEEDQKDGENTAFYNTFFIATVGHSIVVTLVYLATVLLLRKDLDSSFVTLLVLTSTLILVRSLVALIYGVLRSKGQVIKYNLLEIVIKYGSLALGILLLVYFKMGLYGYFLGVVVFEVGVTAIVAAAYWIKGSIDFGSFDRNLYRNVWIYGRALVGFEIASVLLDSADKYMIAFLKSEYEVGIYAVGYALATYTQMLIASPITLAIVPIYVRLWHEEKLDDLRTFLARSLRYYVLVAIPIIFGAVAIKTEAISVLATDKYLESSLIFPVALGGVLFLGAHNITAAGLYVSKNIGGLFRISIYTLIINIVLNYILIQKIGILGAAVATLIAYMAMFVMVTKAAFKKLAFQINIMDIVTATGIGIVLYLAVHSIQLDTNLHTLLSRLVLGTLLFSVMIIAVEPELRKMLARLWHTRK